MEKKTAIDLFSGTGSATKAFQESEKWNVTRVEINEEQEAEIYADVLDLEPEDLPNADFIWASPPCTDFSIACMYDKWTENGLPKKESVSESVKLIYHTLYLINQINPDYWFMENPRGKMRKVVPESLNKTRKTVTYCQYGDNKMKPTDLWGNHPSSFPVKKCSNNSNCHQSAPRGSSKGTQMLSGNTEIAKVPYELSKQIMEAVENPGKQVSQNRLKNF